MPFDTLLGNEQLKSNLSRSLARGHVSHFYLLSGAKGSGKHTLASALAAALLCTGDDKPCLRCANCRRVMENNHPDFITVDDPEKKTVTVGLVRQAREDVFIRPNQSDYKIYLFPRAQDMGLEGQNALLKILEEPPAYGVFLLLTDNPEKLLPTVRSRCTELKLQPLPEGIMNTVLREKYPQVSAEIRQAAIVRSAGFLGQALEMLNPDAEAPAQVSALAQAVAARDSFALLQVLVPCEKMKRDALIPLVQDWMQLFQQALTARSGGTALSDDAQMLAQRLGGSELLSKVQALQKAYEYLNANVSPGAVCGWLEWELR